MDCLYCEIFLSSALGQAQQCSYCRSLKDAHLHAPITEAPTQTRWILFIYHFC